MSKTMLIILLTLSLVTISNGILLNRKGKGKLSKMVIIIGVVLAVIGFLGTLVSFLG
ncbi:hypothetical protein [Neobacillus sp. PS3-40]|uniref:hypothetical protein n=1 Tax=Neobacillus sp. PS3-40 TaxID=3070679 RepID=UPI0027E0CFDB|nr:hypothetical protein [Neobacillus sp. PS3-40]WML46160.1 hypothetical protein RCG20_09825 [Neobacillus sp. PS3-40]